MDEDKISVGPGPDTRTPLVRLREYKPDTVLREILEAILANETEAYLAGMSKNMGDPMTMQSMTAAYNAMKNLVNTILS